MQTQNLNAAHSLYVIYETLPAETQQIFLHELLEKQAQEIENYLFYLNCKEAKDENEFLDDVQAQTFIDSLAS